MAGFAGLRRRLALLLAALSVLALTGAALVTLTDIALRALARIVGAIIGVPAGWAVVGAVDLVQLCVVSCAALAIPAAFLARGHVAVELLHLHLPKPLRALLDLLAALASLLFLGLVFRHGLDQLATVRLMGDRSVTLQITMEAYWIPFLGGIGLAVAATVLDVVESLWRREDGQP